MCFNEKKIKDIHPCIDLNFTFDDHLIGLYNAYKERDKNVINENFYNIGTNILAEQVLTDSKKHSDIYKILSSKGDCRNKLVELAIWRSKMWANGKPLKVKFLGGDSYLHEKVILYAKKWEEIANISFDFVNTVNAEIRVSFLSGNGSWSYIGTDILNITDQTQPTMNFGWFDYNTPDIEFSRTIVHEFGHSLGCIHEHQSPATNIQWNKPLVYDYYWRTQGWDKQKVDNNLFAKFDQNEITNSSFDRNSIMLYPIPREFTTDGYFVGWNSFLSPVDIDFIKKCYPK